MIYVQENNFTVKSEKTSCPIMRTNDNLKRKRLIISIEISENFSKLLVEEPVISFIRKELERRRIEVFSVSYKTEDIDLLDTFKTKYNPEEFSNFPRRKKARKK